MIPVPVYYTFYIPDCQDSPNSRPKMSVILPAFEKNTGLLNIVDTSSFEWLIYLTCLTHLISIVHIFGFVFNVGKLSTWGHFPKKQLLLCRDIDNDSSSFSPKSQLTSFRNIDTTALYVKPSPPNWSSPHFCQKKKFFFSQLILTFIYWPDISEIPTLTFYLKQYSTFMIE